jgi:hypothetical protein
VIESQQSTSPHTIASLSLNNAIIKSFISHIPQLFSLSQPNTLTLLSSISQTLISSNSITFPEVMSLVEQLQSSP